MKHILTLLLLGIPALAFGNAKALNNAVLESELVQVTIKGDTAKVSGTYHFRRVSYQTKGANEPEGVYFPVIVSKGTTGTAEDFKLNLRLNGLTATNYHVATTAPVTAPESDAYSIVWLLASFPGKQLYNLEVTVQYEQKLIDARFYYLPILEHAPPRTKSFEIQVAADRPIRSVGKGAGGVMVKGRRELVFTPAHLSMIVVESDSTTAAKPRP